MTVVSWPLCKRKLPLSLKKGRGNGKIPVMYTDTEGIVLRQTKTLNGRRMLVIFTQRYGKVSAGTSISEKGRTKSALALRPFSYGRYELFKGRDSFSVNGAEAVNGFYGIGEDIDKYMAASSALELTDRLLEEEQPAPQMFALLLDFLELLSARKKAFGTLLIAFRLKCLSLSGCAPVTDACVGCGSREGLKLFSVPAGGLVCGNCAKAGDRLCFEISGSDVQVLRYMLGHPLKNLESLALDEQTELRIQKILRSYYSYHLGIDKLKSEGLSI